MPNFTTTTTITTGRGDTLSASKSGNYDEIFNIRQDVGGADTFVALITASATKGTSTLSDCKSLIIKNDSNVGAEIQIITEEWADATPDSNAADNSHQLYLLAAGDYIYLPSFRQLNFIQDASSGGNAYQLTNQVPDANMYVAVNNPAAGDAQLLDEAIDGSETGVDVDDASFFFAGDLIRIDNEVMEVTSISSNTLTVIRGSHGSALAVHSEDAALRFPFFNAYADFDKYSVAQSDSSGKYKCMNFFGYGRTEGEADGLVPSSVSGKFYEAGYQEWGLSGITPSTKTGLVASTAYKIDIQVDGGTMFQDLTVTTDSSNGNFGGTNGLINKIQAALDTQYYTAGNLYEKRVYIAIVNGDVRVTSGHHLSTSAIGLTDTGDSLSLFDASAVGRIPAAGDLEDPVAARLPQDTILDRKSGISKPNTGAFFYDDGHGNIRGACSGTINYETGALDLQGCPPNAQFVVDANYGSAHSGGNNFTDSFSNCLSSVGARSCNSKLNATVEVIGLK